MALSLNVLNNIFEFLQRVEVKGLEAFALTEVFTAVQTERALTQNPVTAGIPFVPPAPPARPLHPAPPAQQWEEEMEDA